MANSSKKQSSVALNRRRLLQQAFGFGASGLIAPSLWPFLSGCKPSLPASTPTAPLASGSAFASAQPRKFLFVFGATGGASINDSFLAVRQSESRNASTLNTFPDAMVRSIDGTGLRAVDLAMDEIGPLPFPVEASQSKFLAKYYQDMMVTTLTGSSVSHPVAQKRSLTGNDAWNGRTLQEAVAAQYGEGLLLPNVNMSSLGYAEAGTDGSLPAFAGAQPVADPAFFPFSLHGYKGIPGVPDKKLIELARNLRRDRLEPASAFQKAFAASPRVQQWLAQRAQQTKFEELNLIDRLNAFESSKDLPLEDYGIGSHEHAGILREVFPKLGADPLHNQALLAYLLVTQGLSCTVTMGMGMNVVIDGDDPDNPLLSNTPTAFDYSHNAHRATQANLWHRTLDTLDRLITLLKRTEYRRGESFWDHSMIYIATEFGRDKTRQKGQIEFTSGHHTNNGVLIISPMSNGGRVLGGVDPDTLLTYGFDPKSGEPDAGREMTEAEIYAGILQSLGVDTSGSGLPDIRAMRRQA